MGHPPRTGRTSDLLRMALAAAFVSVAHSSLAIAAQPRVDLELAMDSAMVPTEARAWSEMLGQAGFSSVRIRGVKASEEPAIQTSGNESAPSYRVTGVLTSDNQLLLPKGRFNLSDRGRIEQWLRKLRDGGEEGVTVKPAAFGLLPRQLVAVHEALATPVKFSTAGRQPREVAKQIADGLTLKFISDAASQQALAVDEPVADELQGLSSGTVLAAVLRPLGLVLAPEIAGSEVRLRIGGGKTMKEHWPVGGPPKGNPRETLPDLFKYLKIEIDKTPLSESLTAIGERLKTPLLIDRNALARSQIDLSTNVALPEMNTYYLHALDRLLFQAKLKCELRIDEADKPFLWVTTIRQW
jgi:hypothetical protein